MLLSLTESHLMMVILLYHWMAHNVIGLGNQSEKRGKGLLQLTIEKTTL